MNFELFVGWYVVKLIMVGVVIGGIIVALICGFFIMKFFWDLWQQT